MADTWSSRRGGNWPAARPFKRRSGNGSMAPTVRQAHGRRRLLRSEAHSRPFGIERRLRDDSGRPALAQYFDFETAASCFIGKRRRNVALRERQLDEMSEAARGNPT